MNDRANDLWTDWQGLAEQSWQAWRNMARAGADGTATAAGEDAAGMTIQRMLDGMKGWQQWMQAAAAGNLSGEDWQQQLGRMFERAGQPFVQAFSGLDSPGAHGFQHLMQQWNAAQQPFMEGWRQMLGMPAFGFNREHQQQQQQIVLAMVEYAEQMRRYNALIAEANALAVDRLKTLLAQRAETNTPVESVRALYDLWVDAAEDTYAEVAMSAQFRQVYGDLVNAQMRLRSLQNKQVEQASSQLGMPTRTEVDSLGRRLQEVRREVRAADLSSLHEELAALRAEVASLRAGGTGAGKPGKSPAATKAAVAPKAGAAGKSAARKGATRKAATRKAATKGTPGKKR